MLIFLLIFFLGGGKNLHSNKVNNYVVWPYAEKEIEG